MKKRIIVPFAFSALTLLLSGCGGESSKINEDPTKGTTGVTSNTSCDINTSNCLQFVLDYPIAGVNFNCSSDIVHNFATKFDSNAVTGACKLGDTVSFYVQGEASPKISFGDIKLDEISKLKMPTLARIRVIDMAIALTGKTPNALDPKDETIHVALALIKIFQSLGVENKSNVIGDVQPTEITQEKKNNLSSLSRPIGVSELISDEYVDLLKPWVDVNAVSDDQALEILQQLLNLSNTGIWTADLPVFKLGGGSSTSKTTSPDGFFGCNTADYSKCVDASVSNLVHSMGNFLLLTDRQGYILGYGQQWTGAATVTNNTVLAPYYLTSLVKPQKIRLKTQNDWLNPFTYQLNASKPLSFSASTDPLEDLIIKQGKFMNQSTIAGTEGFYRGLTKMKDSDKVDTSHLGQWQQSISNQNIRGVIDIVKVNPASFLSKDTFKTELNVESGQTYLFPLYATLTFRFDEAAKLPPVDLGIVIDEHGNIRTDIRKDATETDMSGLCASAVPNSDGTYTDQYDETQYRIGTTGATLFSTNDKSITVRMLLSNPKFKTIDGVMFGINFSTITGAKINIHNLLNGQPSGINLTNFSNNTVVWSNQYAFYQAAYVGLYDRLTKDKDKYIPPTEEERELAKRWTGTVTIKIADQNNPACKAIKTKA
ncbi:hypothetical protein GPS59_10330 [Acinetobacter haemolyticus]|uniref:putative pilus system protein FilF n=1 Tax=Acinetobacter TaxID=469 RepID=UPI00019AE221|nr:MULTISPECIES: hypothetical protein [Acinetobacter]EEH68064.1 hypothetical protein HMPREF0023_2417 [Acinetobacter sp. ATCC 27244]ENW19418.1 hypothetical protein F926_02989 [Acinetobacter haemolyticus NIPH 261]NAR54395.1 hypothetical protein [Acinetobacter haemolyticus]